MTDSNQEVLFWPYSATQKGAKCWGNFLKHCFQQSNTMDDLLDRLDQELAKFNAKNVGMLHGGMVVIMFENEEAFMQFKLAWS